VLKAPLEMSRFFNASNSAPSLSSLRYRSKLVPLANRAAKVMVGEGASLKVGDQVTVRDSNGSRDGKVTAVPTKGAALDHAVYMVKKKGEWWGYFEPEPCQKRFLTLKKKRSKDVFEVPRGAARWFDVLEEEPEMKCVWWPWAAPTPPALFSSTLECVCHRSLRTVLLDVN